MRRNHDGAHRRYTSASRMLHSYASNYLGSRPAVRWLGARRLGPETQARSLIRAPAEIGGNDPSTKPSNVLSIAPNQTKRGIYNSAKPKLPLGVAPIVQEKAIGIERLSRLFSEK